MDRKEIKARAKETVRQYWGDLFIVPVLASAAASIVGFLTLGVGGLIVSGPLAIGVLYIYDKAMHREDFEYLDLLRYFKTRFGDIVLAMLLVSVLSGAGAVLGLAGTVLGAMIHVLIGLIFYVACIVLIVLIVFGLQLVPVILLREEGIRAKDAVVKSWNMMKGHKFSLFVFYLSFIGWILLVGVTFGLALIWVGPYMRTAQLGFLMDIYEKSPLKGATDVEFDPELMGKVGDFRNKAAEKVETVKNRTATEQAPAETVAEQPAPVIAPVQQTPEANVCKYCGNKLVPGARFCGKCGREQ